MPVLMDIAQSVELDPNEARTVLETQRYKTAVDRDWQRSRTLGINAVPTFVMNGRHLVGAQTYQDLARFVQANIG